MAKSSEMNCEEDPVQLEVSVEFIKREHQECIICITHCVDSFDIQRTRTTLLGIPLHTFLLKLTNVNLNSPGESRHICKTCLDLVNDLENAEHEYVKLKHSFELIIKKNPLFSSLEKKVPLGKVLNIPQKDDLLVTMSDGEDHYSTLIKLEPMSDEDRDMSEVGSKLDSLKTSTQKTIVSAKPRADGASTRKLKTKKRKRKTGEKQQTISEKFECDTCQRQFTQKGNYNRHLTTHSGIMPFECPTCQRRFNRKDHMLTHMRTHTGEKPFECNFCLVKFNQKGSIIKHLRTHTGQEPFECNICHRRFKQRPHLNSHLKIHTGEKPYECNFCKHKFAERSKLKIHLRTHTGERPYECTYCNRQFNQSGNLQSHLRTHTGEKPYECVICQRKFNLKHHLRDHINTHTGVRAFECSVCKQRFNHKHVMKKHLKTMHPIGAVYPSYEVSVNEANTEPEVIIKVNDNAEVNLKSENSCDGCEV